MHPLEIMTQNSAIAIETRSQTVAERPIVLSTAYGIATVQTYSHMGSGVSYKNYNTT